jgi:hypothetical protein
MLELAYVRSPHHECSSFSFFFQVFGDMLVDSLADMSICQLILKVLIM